MKLGVLIPTFGRPDKLQQIADNLKETTSGEYELYWCVEPFDKDTIKAAKKTGAKVILNTDEPRYSNALQAGYEATDEPIFIGGNDDFLFLKDWDKEPMRLMKENKSICVLGVHDGNPNTRFSTISLVRRSYIEEQSGVIDMPNRVVYPYFHNYVDDELTNTAKKRGVWAYCATPCIHHQHHSFTWLGDFPHDKTYAKNDANFAKDTETYYSRVHLWS
jgi:glycosyltransferase involved in cell wall biosynthesis